MLDQISNEVLEFFPSFYYNKDDYFPISEPISPEPIQSFPEKFTVKEMLKIRRQQMHSERSFKMGKYDVFPNHSSPEVPCLTPPMTPNPTEQYPVTPPHEAYSPTSHGEVKMTLFHWQIQQEAKKIEMIPPAQLTMQDSDGDTYLHIAVAKGRRALAYVLAAKMATFGSLDIKEHNGQTALHVAAVSNHHLILQDLLTHGAQINSTDMWGRSPVHVCALKGHFLCLQSIYNTLRGTGQTFDVEKMNYDGLTPLHVAVLSYNAVVKEIRQLENPCAYMKSELAKKKRSYLECIKTLMLMGASYGTKELKSGQTCLHMACEEANLDLLHLFLNQPSSLSVVNAKTFSGNTALHIVSSLPNLKHQAEAAKLLMRSGADPGARNFENDFPSQLVPDGPVGEKVRQILKGKFICA